MPNDDATDALRAAGIDGDDAIDRHSLGVGLRFALDHPERARALLLHLEADLGEPPTDDAAGNAATRRPDDGTIPLASVLLARSALGWRADGTPAKPPSFEWTALLARGDVISIGQTVGTMLAGGAPADITRGFGLAWDAGHRLPVRDARALFGVFIELQRGIAAVLAGHELPPGRPMGGSSGLASVLGSLLARPDPSTAEVVLVLQRSGELGQRGLIAVWNAWAATCFRDLLPPELHDELVQPWVTVVGPLPEA